jgi:hypothetical protein
MHERINESMGAASPCRAPRSCVSVCAARISTYGWDAKNAKMMSSRPGSLRLVGSAQSTQHGDRPAQAMGDQRHGRR